MSSCLSVFVLKIIIGILNIPIFLYGTGIIPPMVILTSVGDSDVSEELKLGNPIIIGIVIGSIAITAVILFFVASCCVCLPDIITRIFVFVYCGLMVLKIILEVIFLVKISMVQSSMNDTLEKYFVNAILKAGGREDLAEKDLTYKQFQALPNISKSSYTCNEDCKFHKKLMDDIQSELECCGIEFSSDWNKVRTDVPESCCTSSNCKIIRKAGCMGEVKDIVEKVVTILLYVVIAAMALQIACIVFGYLLYRALK